MMKNVCSPVCRCLLRFASLKAVGGMRVSCDTPVRLSSALQGTYWESALVTELFGGTPQTVRWGPPQLDILTP